MKPLGARLLLSLVLLARAASAQVETGRAAESASGANSAAAGASLNAPPAPIALVASPLGAASMSAAPFAFAGAVPAAFAAPAAVEAPKLAPALAEPAALPAAAAALESGAASRAPPQQAAAEPAEESPADRGRALFDAAEPAKNDGSVWSRIKGWAGLGDRAPSWPGTAGEKIRLGGRSFTLDRRMPDGGGASLWRVKWADYVVKILPPQSARAGGEAALLRAIRDSDIPHSRLIAASADGRVMVKERVDGSSAAELLPKGFEARHREGWAELGAKLIRAGSTADLSPKNLIWQHWRTRWAIVDPMGISAAGPEKVLAQLLTPETRRAGVDAGAFLAALRGRLGPDSREWARTLAALPMEDFGALAAHDRALPPPPQVVFAPSPRSPPYPDAVGPAADAAKALGYPPRGTEPRRALHADDPGKTNTIVYAVEPEGKPHIAVKIAQWSIIRNELALRRVIRRWFGTYFDEPSAFGVKDGHDSYLAMELKPGSQAYGSNPLSREQRAALAVLVHAFGVSDMNPGNVLFPAQGLPVLLDFEVALHRAAPVAGRIPDEGIALEMPWMSRFELNRAEDYQPAARAWRALMAKPESSAALLADFQAAGFTAEEAGGLIEVVKANTADLDWTIQNDVEFVNQFVASKQRAAAR